MNGPRLLFGLLAGAGLAAALFAPSLALSTQVLQFRSKTHLEEVERFVFDRVNPERTRRGFEALVSESDLARIARDYSMDMLERDYVDHVNPDGKGTVERVRERHRRLVGEVSETSGAPSGLKIKARPSSPQTSWTRSWRVRDTVEISSLKSCPILGLAYILPPDVQ